MSLSLTFFGGAREESENPDSHDDEDRGGDPGLSSGLRSSRVAQPDAMDRPRVVEHGEARRQDRLR